MKEVPVSTYTTIILLRNDAPLSMSCIIPQVKTNLTLQRRWVPEDGFLGPLGDGYLGGELQGLPPGHHFPVRLLQHATRSIITFLHHQALFLEAIAP